MSMQSTNLLFVERSKKKKLDFLAL